MLLAPGCPEARCTSVPAGLGMSSRPGPLVPEAPELTGTNRRLTVSAACAERPQAHQTHVAEAPGGLSTGAGIPDGVETSKARCLD